MRELAPHFPNPDEYHIWTPSEKFMSVVISTLLNKCVPHEEILVNPPIPCHQPPSSLSKQLAVSWPSAPYSKPSRTKDKSYKSSESEFHKENLYAPQILSSLSLLKVTYGSVS